MKYHGESGLLLFLGNEESGMNYKDNTYPYRQDSTFLYFSDWTSPVLRHCWTSTRVCPPYSVTNLP